MNRFARMASFLAAALLVPAVAKAVPVCPVLTGASSSYQNAANLLGDNCNTLITVNSNNTLTITIPNPTPYEGVEDQYVGVINNSSSPITALTLTSAANDIFGFDGDGINGFGISGNVQDNTGYGGPNAFFTGISGNGHTGTVNFITPIAPGGTGYFSLEDAPSSGTDLTGQVGGAVPEPSTLMLLGTGALGIASRLRKRLQA